MLSWINVDTHIVFCYVTVTTLTVFNSLRYYMERNSLIQPTAYLKYGEITKNHQIKCFKKLKTVLHTKKVRLQAFKSTNNEILDICKHYQENVPKEIQN